MNRFKKLIPMCLFLLVIVTSCNDDDEIAAVAVNPPSEAMLIFPENNTVCNEGTIFSETQTEVLFRWEELTYATSYVLQITNLNDGTSRNINTIETEFLIRIDRGTPYSWSVKSTVSGSNVIAQSPVWRFYNAGIAQESHPPFPANIVSPQSGSSVNQGSISLQWNASDIDNDIATYTVLFDTVNPPIVEAGTTSNSNFNVSVLSGQVYFWKVITTDEAGNTSDSQIFQFIVN
jgi:hypothetical protein